MGGGFQFRASGTAPTRQQIEAALEVFAELMSDDRPLNDIADIMGISRGSACVYLAMIRQRLGGQAI